MRNPTLKTIILSAGAAITLIITLQVLWLSKVSNIYSDLPQREGPSTGPVEDAFNLWIIVACLLVLVLLSMVVMLFIFYRQRYKQEAQKDLDRKSVV